MLEAITDFWKPVKKSTPPKIKLTDMQIGTVVGFGYVPQTTLSGRKLTVTAINSYQFGKDVLTSFVLSNEKDGDVSMIIAEAQGEQYLAISRRLSASERAKLFEEGSIEIVTSKNEVGNFSCKDNVPDLKGWLVTSYKREIQGMRGFIHHADFRNGSEGSHSGQEFEYSLLGSSSNEHAIEIESYADGHTDVYATVYRRTSDISEVIHRDESENRTPPQLTQPDVKLAVVNSIDKPVEAVAPAPVVEKEVAASDAPRLEIVKEVAKEEVKNEPSKLDSVKLELLALPELIITPLAPEIKKSEITEPAKTETKPTEVKNDKETAKENQSIKNNNEEKKIMSTATNENKSTGTNGVAGVELKPVPSFGSSNIIQEIKPVTKTTNGMENDSLDCDLRIANQIIDEAIRNEMRLSDVVRRIIELPVAHQEAVQIPISLADEDYSLLAIRYGIPSSDRNAIKLRIIQDLGDFSGSKKKVN